MEKIGEKGVETQRNGERQQKWEDDAKGTDFQFLRFFETEITFSKLKLEIFISIVRL